MFARGNDALHFAYIHWFSVAHITKRTLHTHTHTHTIHVARLHAIALSLKRKADEAKVDTLFPHCNIYVCVCVQDEAHWFVVDVVPLVNICIFVPDVAFHIYTIMQFSRQTKHYRAHHTQNNVLDVGAMSALITEVSLHII